MNAIQSLHCYCFRLASQKEQFLEKKETLVKEIRTKKEFLDSLQPRLENILKVKTRSDERIKCAKSSFQCHKNFEEYVACLPYTSYFSYDSSTLTTGDVTMYM